MKKALALIILLIYLQPCTQAKEPVYIFKNGKEGYPMYRIPTLIKTHNNTLLAFCEGRRSLADHGNIDIVMKCSTDNGNTWSALKVIWNDAKNTCGNACPVIDEASGDVILITTWNNLKVFTMRSADNGNSWSKPVDITATVKPAEWRWYATGPVHAIQLEHTFKGRIVVPCNHTLTGAPTHYSNVIFSDDHGLTWQTGGTAPCADSDECTIAELNDGRLMLNMRNNDGAHKRKVSYSSDGGLSWSACITDTALIEPVCQGSLLHCQAPKAALFFSNPNSAKGRKHLTVHCSTNEGQSWGKQVLLCKGPSAYSDMVQLNAGNLLCIFERGIIWPYGGIAMMAVDKSFIDK